MIAQGWRAYRAAPALLDALGELLTAVEHKH
jgi:hypothetical protein